MNIKEAINRCCIDGGFPSCEECGMFGDNECWKYLSEYLLEECEACRCSTYYYVNDCKEIEKIKPKFCPDCGRAL